MSKRLSKRQLREQQELQSLSGSAKVVQGEEEGGAAAEEHAKGLAVAEENIDGAGDVDREGVTRNSAGAGLFSQVSARGHRHCRRKLTAGETAAG